MDPQALQCSQCGATFGPDAGWKPLSARPAGKPSKSHHSEVLRVVGALSYSLAVWTIAWVAAFGAALRQLPELDPFLVIVVVPTIAATLVVGIFLTLRGPFSSQTVGEPNERRLIFANLAFVAGHVVIYAPVIRVYHLPEAWILVMVFAVPAASVCYGIGIVLYEVALSAKQTAKGLLLKPHIWIRLAERIVPLVALAVLMAFAVRHAP